MVLLAALQAAQWLGINPQGFAWGRRKRRPAQPWAEPGTRTPRVVLCGSRAVKGRTLTIQFFTAPGWDPPK